MSHNDEYQLALAVRITQGQIKVNGQILAADSTKLPEGVFRADAYFIVPENALLDTVDDAIFYLHPANTAQRTVSSEQYAEVRGDTRDFRVCVTAPSATRGKPEEDHRRNKTPVSYLNHYTDLKKRPFLELQVNEGCIRIALQEGLSV